VPREAVGKTGVPSSKRQKPERPRDELGRPLAWAAENLLQLPDFAVLSLEENHELGRRFVREQNWFGAHEAWETAWKQARGTGDEELFKGLSQMGAGYVHLRRGNAHGAQTLLLRAARRIAEYPSGHLGVPTVLLAARLRSDAAAVADGSLVPGPDAAVEPPDV
jgi:predicted metal-dependent hydrolase